MQEAFRLKQREPRRNVMIKARMRAAASWSDALILNMSSRGLLVRTDRSPGRGSYLEICRGPHVIVARVVWSSGDRFGAQTQDPIPTDDLIRDPDRAVAPARGVGTGFQERRAVARPAAVSHESSRQKARIAEFAVIALACGLGAIFIGSAVAEVVAKPLGAAGAALEAK